MLWFLGVRVPAVSSYVLVVTGVSVYLSMLSVLGEDVFEAFIWKVKEA